jgi:hypothetical protein
MKLKVSMLAVSVGLLLAISAGPAFAWGDDREGDGQHSWNVQPIHDWNPCDSALARYLSWCGGGDYEKPSNSVPEPGSALVFGAGLLVVGQHLRRKNRR